MNLEPDLAEISKRRLERLAKVQQQSNQSKVPLKTPNVQQQQVKEISKQPKNIAPTALSPTVAARPPATPISKFTTQTNTEWQAEVDSKILSSDQSIIAHLETHTSQDTFNFLLKSYNITLKLKAFITANHPEHTTRLNIISGYSEVIISYAGLVLTELLEIGLEGSRGPEWIAQCMLQEQISKPFMEAFLERFEGDGLDVILSLVIMELHREMTVMRISANNHGRIFKALTFAFSFPQIINHLIKLPQFNPTGLTPPQFETISFFGPLLSLTAVLGERDPDILTKYFPTIESSFGSTDDTNLSGFNIGKRNLADVKSSMKMLHGISCDITSNLFTLVMTIVKTSPASKEAILSYFANAININKSRDKMQVDPRTVSTDGFMQSIVGILDKMVEPIVDANFSKLPLIDPTYFIHSPRLDTTDVTRVSADQQTTDEYYADVEAKNVDPPAANFVSDIFYLASSAHHYGMMRTVRAFGEIPKRVESFQHFIDEHEGNPDPRAIQQIKHVKLEMVIASRMAYEAVLLQPMSIIQTLGFYNLVIAFLMRTVYVGTGAINHGPKVDSINWSLFMRGNTQSLSFTLGEGDVPLLFTTFPEWMFIDICDYYQFVARHNPPVFQNLARDEFFTFCMFFLHNSHMIKNPYVKSKLVEVLFVFGQPLYYYADGTTKGHLDVPFSTHTYCKEYFVSSILRFYVDVEQSGMQNQFYEKFTIRYNISKILKKLLDFQSHNDKLFALSRNLDFFVKFINLLMNDTTYLLDEGLSELSEIKKIQDEQADVQAWAALSKEDRDARLSKLSSAENHARWAVRYSGNAVSTLNLLTSKPNLVALFIEPYLVDRLAGMMNKNLAELTGKRCTQLKVANPEKYDFKPKKLLLQFLHIFLNLSERPEFVLACAKDSRSFSPASFEHGMSVLGNSAMMSAAAISKLRVFLTKVEESMKQEEEDDQVYDDIPDDFLDPLMYTLMKDPVLLPTSNTILDRSTIIQHLLSDQHDPFNRSPLTIEMVVSATDIKKQIDDWKASKRAEKRVEIMDTAED